VTKYTPPTATEIMEHALAYAGWVHVERAGKTRWQDPESGVLYDTHSAFKLQEARGFPPDLTASATPYI
jgi:hypothetical protein